MQARFLLGPAGSGKTFRCLTEIRAALRENPEGASLVLLAPKQATFQLERQLLDSERWGERPREPKLNSTDGSPGASPWQINGYTRLQIFSFERLARHSLKELKLTPPDFLTDEGRVMVLRALLMRHEDELKLFRQSARRPGFAQQLGQLFNELLQHQFTPAKLRTLAERKSLRRELQHKLHDLARLLDAYVLWLKDHDLSDGNHLLEAATAGLRQKTLNSQLSTLNFGALWLDGFAEMTPQEMDLLAAVLPFCGKATLAFCLDESGAGILPASPNTGVTPVPHSDSWLSIWSAIGKTFQQCRQRVENLPGCKIEIQILPRDSGKSRFENNPGLAVLEKNWTQPTQNTESRIQNPESAVQVITCQNAEAEAAFAAREILRFVRRGNRFRDCAVLVRNLDHFHKPLARVFRRYEIPFFLDRRESVAHHPLAELTRSALRTVVFDWPHDDWFAALKAGFSPVEETEIDRLENESLARGWRGRKWREPIQIADQPELEKSVERLRQKLLPPFEILAKRLKHPPDGNQLAEAVRELWAGLKIEATLERWTLDQANSSTDMRHPSIHSTVWEQMNAWLDNVALAFSHESLPLRDWLPVLEAGLTNLTVGVVPPVLDEVLIGAVDRARNPDLKFMLVLGANESVFPATPVSPTILTDADREELNGQNVAPGPDLRDQLSRERFYGYIACTRASEKLILSFSRHDAEGKGLNPSPFIAHLQRIFPKLEIEEFQNEIGLAEIEHSSELAPLVFNLFRRGELCESQTKDNQGLMELVPPNFQKLREPDSTENLSPLLTEKLYGPVLRTSVSRLEEFAQCPFKFFVRAGLRAAERKVFELDARERGSFQHDVLKAFHEQLAAEGKRWRNLTPPEARERIGVIAAGLMGNYRDGLLRDSPRTEFEARALTSALQDFVEVIVSWMRSQYEFDPAAVELGFGGRADRVPAWEIELSDGRKLALQGRIDRVDLCRSLRTAPDEAGAIVMDYKSSQKKLDALLVGHGIQLQLLAYLNVLRHWKNPRDVFSGVNRLIPAGTFYVNLRGEYKSGGSRDEILADADEARRRAYRHAGRFDASALDQLDRAGAADQFNYRRNQDGSLHKGSVEALPRAEFEKLLDGVETQLREMGGKIFSGEAKVNPYRKGKQTPCEFCDYQAACRIDKWTHEWRVLRAVSKPTVSDIPAPS